MVPRMDLSALIVARVGVQLGGVAEWAGRNGVEK